MSRMERNGGVRQQGDCKAVAMIAIVIRVVRAGWLNSRNCRLSKLLKYKKKLANTNNYRRRHSRQRGKLVERHLIDSMPGMLKEQQ